MKATRGCITLAVALGALALSPEARAEEQVPGRWYGYQTLGADAAALALIGGGIALGSASDSAAAGLALAVPGTLLYFGGGPGIRRLAHGDGPGATSSFLRRLLLPLAGAAVGAGVAALATSPGRSDVCNDRRACAAAIVGAAGFGMGMNAAILYDAATAREPPPASPGAAAVGVSLAPALALSRGGAMAGLRLVF
jgi:hypothetical protein